MREWIRKFIRRRWLTLCEVLLLVAVLVWVGWSLNHQGKRPTGAVSIKLQMRDAYEEVHLFRDGDGSYRFRVTSLNKTPRDLTPEQFAGQVYQDHRSRGFWSMVFNITSPMGYLWVGLGLLGQVLFTGRMIVQWLASEKKHKSVVPPMFWWMSLVGATMLLIYFLWRKDVVGVIGQSAGWFIYVRNLFLIYQAPEAGPPSDDAEADPSPQPVTSGERS